MNHVRGAHDVPWVVKSASKSSHSGISTDVLLFSEINLSLVHHYRVHRRGLTHVAFRRDYMAGLRALLRWLSLRIMCCHQFRSALLRRVGLALPSRD